MAGDQGEEAFKVVAVGHLVERPAEQAGGEVLVGDVELGKRPPVVHAVIGDDRAHGRVVVDVGEGELRVADGVGGEQREVAA